MVATVLNSISTLFVNCTRWFAQILSAVGGTNTYYTAVFTAMTCGFLLSRFGSALSIGSDKAAQTIKKGRKDK